MATLIQPFQKIASRLKSSAVSQIISKFQELESTSLGDATKDQIAYHIVDNSEDLQECYELAYQVYLKKGFVAEGQVESVASTFDHTPNTLIVAAKNKKDEIVGSITLVLSCDGELPCEKLFFNEVNQAGLVDKSYAEVTRLVIADEYRHCRDILVHLIRYAVVYSYSYFECESALIEVNPRHVAFYQRAMFFEVISEIKECARVKNAPAVLLSINWRVLANAYRNYKHEGKYQKTIYSKIYNEIEYVAVKKEVSLYFAKKKQPLTFLQA